MKETKMNEKRLSVPKNPARALRELNRQATDKPDPVPEHESPVGSHVTAQPEINTAALPEMNTVALPAASTITLPATDTTPLPKVTTAESHAVQELREIAGRRRAGIKAAKQRGSTAVQTTSSAVGSATGSDPVRQAMLGMLAQPYPADMDDGAMTVTSVKIPKPLWERLDYARAITKKDKQDIIAEALRLYFDQLVRGIVE